MYQKNMIRFLSFLAAASITLLSGHVPAADNLTQIRVLKNNALEVNGEEIILFGIAVPTATEKCRLAASQWPCGASATLRLSTIFNSAPFTCIRLEDEQSTPLARCSNEEFDIAEQLVLEGWAVTVADNMVYARQEKDAKDRQVGIWRDGYSPPQRWRSYPNLEIDPIKDLQCSVCAARKE